MRRARCHPDCPRCRRGSRRRRGGRRIWARHQGHRHDHLRCWLYERHGLQRRRCRSDSPLGDDLCLEWHRHGQRYVSTLWHQKQCEEQRVQSHRREQQQESMTLTSRALLNGHPQSPDGLRKSCMAMARNEGVLLSRAQGRGRAAVTSTDLCCACAVHRFAQDKVQMILTRILDHKRSRSSTAVWRMPLRIGWPALGFKAKSSPPTKRLPAIVHDFTSRGAMHCQRCEDDRTTPGDPAGALGVNRSSGCGFGFSPGREDRPQDQYRHGLPHGAHARGG